MRYVCNLHCMGCDKNVGRKESTQELFEEQQREHEEYTYVGEDYCSYVADIVCAKCQELDRMEH